MQYVVSAAGVGHGLPFVRYRAGGAAPALPPAALAPPPAEVDAVEAEDADAAAEIDADADVGVAAVEAEESVAPAEAGTPAARRRARAPPAAVTPRRRAAAAPVFSAAAAPAAALAETPADGSAVEARRTMRSCTAHLWRLSGRVCGGVRVRRVRWVCRRAVGHLLLRALLLTCMRPRLLAALCDFCFIIDADNMLVGRR